MRQQNDQHRTTYLCDSHAHATTVAHVASSVALGAAVLAMY
ncbi:hypothetical protein ABT218_29050 [Streptomyces sp. NPDC001455]